MSLEAQDTIDQILEADENIFYAVDEKLENGETTEEGIRLRTPLFIKTTSDNLGKYGSRITFTDKNETLSLIHFGNW